MWAQLRATSANAGQSWSHPWGEVERCRAISIGLAQIWSRLRAGLRCVSAPFGSSWDLAILAHPGPNIPRIWRAKLADVGRICPDSAPIWSNPGRTSTRIRPTFFGGDVRTDQTPNPSASATLPRSVRRSNHDKACKLAGFGPHCVSSTGSCKICTTSACIPRLCTALVAERPTLERRKSTWSVCFIASAPALALENRCRVGQRSGRLRSRTLFSGDEAQTSSLSPRSWPGMWPTGTTRCDRPAPGALTKPTPTRLQKLRRRRRRRGDCGAS